MFPHPVRFLSDKARMSKERILVVDDSAASRKLFSVLLKEEGYSVKSAVDSDQALPILNSFKPDLVLMDVLQPGAHGWELHAVMRRTTVVALTSCITPSDVESVLASGCEALIMKPINPRTFVALVRMNLSKA